MKNKSRLILLGLVILLIIILTFFGKEVIKEKNTRIISLENKILIKNKENKALKLLLLKKSENKDITIIETKNKNGSYTKSKHIKTNKTSSSKSIKSSITKSKSKYIKTNKTSSSKSIKSHTNPKRLRIGLGIDSNFNKEIYGSYNIIGPMGIYGSLNTNSTVTVGIFLEF